MKFGDMELFSLSDGIFRLDGGAMFGVVPKVFWNRLNPADEQNRIELGLNSLLIKTEQKNILIDTGIGDKFDEKFIEIYKIEKQKDLTTSLGEIGLSLDDVDIVVNTHLHFDHCGGNTKKEEKKVVPTFPRARYYIQKGEWEDACNPNERTKASYLKDNFVPIEENGQLQLIDGDTEIVSGVKTVVTGGHTPHHQSILINSAGKTAFYLGDLIPTASHIKIPYVMGYDLLPLDTIRKKKEMLEKAQDENWLLIFEHDPKITMGYLEDKDGKVCIKTVGEN